MTTTSNAAGFNTNTLDRHDIRRISEMKVIPKALVIKQLISKNNNASHQMPREEFNIVSQTAAQFSGNPINSMLHDHMEYGRAQSRGPIDYDIAETYRNSLDGYPGDKRKSLNLNYNSPKRVGLAQKFSSGINLNQTDVSPQNTAASPGAFGRVSREQVRTASQGMRRPRIFSTKFPGAPHQRQKSAMSHNSSTGTPLNRRSEYDIDEMECIERLGTQTGIEDESLEGKTLDKLRMSLSPKKKQNDLTIDQKKEKERAEPVDKFASSMKDELDNYKSDLSRQTNVENLIAHLSTKYLAKYAQHDPTANMTSEMQEFVEKNPDFNLKTQLDEIRHQIAMELFNISKVVDDGNFHIQLQKGSEQQLILCAGIPVCCKISLEGMQPPLNLRVSFENEKEKRNNNLTVYGSFKVIEPCEEKNDMAYVPLKKPNINIPGERGPKPNIKIFTSNIIYFTFISQKGATINLKPIF